MMKTLRKPAAEIIQVLYLGLGLFLIGPSIDQLAAQTSTSTTASNSPRQDEVRVIRDVAYANSDNIRQTLHLVLPAETVSDEPKPLIVFIHGGAWRAGNKQGAVGRLRRYVQSGDYVAASIGYRLTDEAIWPSQIHDCKAAIRWLRANAEEYGIDPNRIAVMGSSAGGHLAAMLGTTSGNSAYEGEIGDCLDHASNVQCVVDLYGPTDLLRMNDVPGKMDHNAEDSPESQLVGGKLQTLPEAARSASPMHVVSPQCPPFLIVHGQQDKLVILDQSLRFHLKLRELRVPCVLIQVEQGGHGGFQNPLIESRIESFLRQQLLKESAVLHDETISNEASDR